MSFLAPNICGNEFENDGAAWIDTKCSFPTLSLYERDPRIDSSVSLDPAAATHETLPHESSKPNVPFDWLVVIVRAIRTTL